MAGNIFRKKARSLIPNSIAYSQKNENHSYSVSETPWKAHKARCERLLEISELPPEDINFVWVLSRQKFPSSYALEQLAAIEKRHLRTCRLCNRDAEIISKFNYHCNNCGLCLNLDFGGGAQ